MKAISVSIRWALLGAAISACNILSVAVHAQTPLHITHQYSNVDARSMIGLPMGNHKTIVTKDGQLQWSQWSLVQKGRAVNFGFSEQLDGALGIRMSERHGDETSALVTSGQRLDGMRFPFVITEWKSKSLSVTETAFATTADNRDLDVVEMVVSNHAAEAVTLELRLDGKQRNLPAMASGSQLATRDGKLLAVVEPANRVQTQSTEAHGLTLVQRRQCPRTARSSSGSSCPTSFVQRK